MPYEPGDVVPIKDDTLPSEVETSSIASDPIWSPLKGAVEVDLSRYTPGKVVTRGNILEEANHIVGGDRQNDYGTPEENWNRISNIASAMCEMDLTPEVCVKVLIATKLARTITSPLKRDNYVDLAGYAHILHRVAGEKA